MRRSRFLPLFFTFLSIAFVIALYFRLRTEMSERAKTAIAAPGKTTSPEPTPAQTPGETMTLEPMTAGGGANGQLSGQYPGPAANATAPPRIMPAPQPQPHRS